MDRGSILVVLFISSVLSMGQAVSALPWSMQRSGPSGAVPSVPPASGAVGGRAFNSTEHVGYTGTAPTIDGILSKGEWDDAAVYNIGTASEPVNLYIMFDDNKIYVAVDAIADTTKDVGDPQTGYITADTTDYFLISYDGEDDGKITYTDPDPGDSVPGEYPLTWNPPGRCVDRSATTTGGSHRLAGFLNTNSGGGGIIFWTMNAPNQGATDPFDYMSPGFDHHRTYEDSIPYHGTGDELGLDHGSKLGISVLVHDYRSGSSPATIGRIPAGATGIGPPFQEFRLNGKPRANISSPTADMFMTDQPILFDGSHSTDPEGDPIATYAWSFNYDGKNFYTSVTGQTVSHSYPDKGVHTVALKVWDPVGASDLTTKTLRIMEHPMPPTITKTSPSEDPVVLKEGTLVPLSAYLDDPNLDEDTEMLHIEWTVDGKSLGLNTAKVPGQTTMPLKANYTGDMSAGKHVVQLKVKDSYNASGLFKGGPLEAAHTWNLTITDVNRPPVITGHNPENLTGLRTNEETPVAFNITRSDPDGDNMTVSWYVDGVVRPGAKGDGFVYLAKPDYTAAGARTVRVEVTDDGAPNLNTSLEWTVDIGNIEKPPLIISVDPPVGTIVMNETEERDFLVKAMDYDGRPLTYRWLIDGYEVPDATNGSFSFLTDYTTANGDNHHLMLNVSNGKQAVSLEWVIFVNNVDRRTIVSVDWPLEDARYVLSQPVPFDASRTLDPDMDDALSYAWDFGDSTSKNVPYAAHRYAAPGNYTARLTVTTSHFDGKEVSVVRVFNITVDGAILKVVSVEAGPADVTTEKDVTITIRIRNSGTIEAKDVVLGLVMDGKKVAERGIGTNIKPNGVTDYKWTWRPSVGEHNFSAVVTGDKDTVVLASDAHSGLVRVRQGYGLGPVVLSSGAPLALLLVLAAVIVGIVLALVLRYRAGRKRAKKEEPEEGLEVRKRGVDRKGPKKERRAKVADSEAPMPSAVGPSEEPEIPIPEERGTEAIEAGTVEEVPEAAPREEGTKGEDDTIDSILERLKKA